MDLRNDCTMQAAAPGFEAATGEAGEPFYIFEFGRAQRGNAAIGKVALVVESSGIAKVPRQLKLRRETEALSVLEGAHGDGVRVGGRGIFGEFLGRTLAVDAESYAGMNMDDLAGVVGGQVFGFDIKRLAGFSEATGLEAAVTSDVSDDLKRLAASGGLNAGVEAG